MSSTKNRSRVRRTASSAAIHISAGATEATSTGWHEENYSVYVETSANPGTALYSRFLKEGRLIDKEWWLKDGYNFGEVSFMPNKFTPDELSEECYNARMKFYSASNIFRRLDFKANCKDPFRDPFQTFAFISANFISQKGIKQRQSWPIGNVIDKHGKILE